MKTSSTFLIKVLFLILSLPSLAGAGAVITYHGRLLNAQDRPLEASNVTFRIQIYSPNPSKCLLYEESRSIDMTNSQGVFVIPIGDGEGTRTGADPGLPIEKVFANNGVTIPSLSCNSTTSYTSQALDQRQMVVSYDDHTGYGWDTLPLMGLNYVPSAVNSHDAQHIGGVAAQSVLRVVDPTPSSPAFSATPLTPAGYNELLAVVSGTTTQYEKAGKLNGSSVPSLGNGQVLGWTGGGWSAITPMTSYTETDPSVKGFAKSDLPTCPVNSFLQNDGSGSLVCTTISGAEGGTVTSVSAGTGLRTDQPSNAAITGAGILSVDVGTGAGQIVQMDSSGKLPAVDGSQLGNVMASGLSNMASINTSGNITTTGSVSGAQITASGDIVSTNGNIQTNKSLTVKEGLFLYDAKTPTPGSVGLKAPTDVPTNYVLTLPTNQGTNGQVLGMSATTGQLTWVNPSSGSVTSVTAEAPLSVDNSNAASPKVAIGKADASQDGYLSQTDWAVFNSKQSAGNYITALSGDVTSGTFTAGSMATTVTKIQGQSVNAALPTADGQALLWDSGSWKAGFIKAEDVKNSAGLTMFPGTACAANQAMNWSAVTDSFSCQPIASLSAAAITSGTFTMDRLGTGTADATKYLSGDGTWKTLSTSDATKLPLAGGTMSGDIDMGTKNITNAAGVAVGVVSTNTVKFTATTPATPDVGSVWYEGGVLKYRNGAGTQTLGVAGSGIQSINGSTGNAQTLVPLASATSFGFNTSGSTHTLEIPLASAAGVTAGVLSNSQFNTFNNKQDALGFTPVNKAGDTMNGDLTFVTGKGTVYPGTSAKTVTLLGPNAAIGTSYVLRLPTAQGAVNQVMINNGSGVLSWATLSTMATSGTVNNSNWSGTELSIANGGTNSSTALTNNKVMVSSGGKIVESAALTNGQILIGSTAGAPAPAALTAGTGISIVNGANSISISATGVAPTGAAGGDLSGLYPAPTIGKINGTTVAGATATGGVAGDANKVPLLGATGLLPITMLPTLTIAKGGTGATTQTGAQTALGIGTAGTKNTGSVSGNVPVVGVSGITANKMCTADGTSSIICNTDIPGTQWDTNGANIYRLSKVGIGAADPGAFNRLRVTPVCGGGTGVFDATISFSAPACTSIAGDDGGSGPTVGVLGKDSSAAGIGVMGYNAGPGVGGFFLSESGPALITGKGKVGIGTATPTEKLEVTGNVRVTSGQIYSNIQTSVAGSPLTFNTNLGNSVVWDAGTLANPVVNIHNMKPGGSYMVVVKGTGTGSVTLNCYSDAGSTMLAGSFVPVNSDRIPGTLNKTVYNLISDGTNCLVSWITGY